MKSIILLPIFLSFMLSTSAFALPKEKSVVDIHAHIGCIGIKSDCFMSEGMKRSFKFKLLLKSFGTNLKEMEMFGDELPARKLDQKIKESKYIRKTVILALDGLIDPAAEKDVDPNSKIQSKEGLDLEKTPNFVPNDFVYGLTKKFDSFYFGASINPNRKNALVLLDQAIAQGAVLVKLIPNIMGINLSDKSYIPFYLKLVKYNIPLLVHVGDEAIFNRTDNSLGDPRLLELPLQLGVKVIAAHLGTTGVSDEQPNFEHFLNLSRKYKNLYSDFSGMTNLNRKKYLKGAVSDNDIADRILFGSDYPLINISIFTSPIYQIPIIPPAKIRTLLQIKNPFDRDIELKEYLGLRDNNYTLFKEVLRLPSN